MEKEQEENKVSACNLFKQHLKAITATFMLWLVYLVGRAIRAPLWWVKIENFKTWNHIPEEFVKEDWEKEIARSMNLMRTRDMLLTIVSILLTLIYIFVPMFWFLIVIGTLALTSFIFVVVAFISIRSKRIKKEREEQTQIT